MGLRSSQGLGVRKFNQIISSGNSLKWQENWSNHFFDTLSQPPLPLLLLLFWCGGRGQVEKNVDQKKTLQENGQISFSYNMTAPSPIPTLVPLSPYHHRHPCYPDMEFVKNFTLQDFQAKNFTPSISPNFNSFSDKNTKK